ncbi:MAG: hypothetical protein AVDCRST_MAG14-22 [uncultured Rubrobacteraceae bacterium]|uniref:DUF3006 domain-containing protein n=1 Tax=uncultured Rubrobacteraceae bacterium TaxID=349277 RepID=A0A6J4QJM6_9ACTN|nr:MAG: hypothetical protein AVDCRST_MAG14-22 [uncultured Rubrobacteraceae bacterium]
MDVALDGYSQLKTNYQKSGNILSYMRVQIDKFEDNEMVLLLLCSGRRRSFDVPRELLPEGARAGDVFELSFAHDREETERLAVENKSLLDDLLGRDG